METPEQQIIFLQQDIANLKQQVAKFKTLLELNLEAFGVNIKHIAEKTGNALLTKRPCEECNGKGIIVEEAPARDPRLDEGGSLDCSGGAAPGLPSKPCTACDTIGIVWK